MTSTKKLRALEAFVGQNPSAAPVVGDGTLWTLAFENKEAGLLAPEFPLSCRQLTLLCPDEGDREWRDTIREAEEAVRRRLGVGMEETEVAEFVRMFQEELNGKTRQTDSYCQLTGGMARVLGEIDELVGWDKVREIAGCSVTLQSDDAEDAVSVTLSVPASYPRDPPAILDCQLPAPPSLSGWDAGASTMADVYQAFMAQARQISS